MAVEGSWRTKHARSEDLRADSSRDTILSSRILRCSQFAPVDSSIMRVWRELSSNGKMHHGLGLCVGVGGGPGCNGRRDSRSGGTSACEQTYVGKVRCPPRSRRHCRSATQVSSTAITAVEPGTNHASPSSSRSSPPPSVLP